MHIVGIIIGLIVLYNLWDYLFYIVGGVIGLMALIFFGCATEEHSKPNGDSLSFLIIGAMCCGLSYCAFSYQVNSWHNTELIAQEQAQKAAEKAQAEAERKAREEAEKIQKNIERANQLSGYEQEIFYSKFQEYITSGLDENSAREKALAEVDAMLAAQAEAERKAREEAESKAAESEKPATVAQKRINIESLKSVNANVLAEQVIEYINANPDKKGRLINYVLNLKLLTAKRDSKIKDRNTEGEIILNNIPLIGGLIVDKSWDDFISSYKRAIVNEITNDTVMKNILDRYHENRPGKGFITITDTAYETLSNMYLIDPNDIENYNALIKIAAIKYHAVEAYVEDNKVRLSLDPGIFDVIDVVSYAAFSAKDNREKYKSSQQAFDRICSALSIDLKNCRTKEDIAEYLSSLIPRYMFPYELEETYLPADKSVVFTENSAKDGERRRVYEMLRGTWKSLITDRTAVIETFPENDNSPRTPRVNYIDVLDKKEAYARFNYFFPSGNRVDVFITPALYVKDGHKTKVLVMYSNYKLIKGGESTVYKNGRVENISSAEDVFIKIVQ